MVAKKVQMSLQSGAVYSCRTLELAFTTKSAYSVIFIMASEAFLGVPTSTNSISDSDLGQ
jgi:hypothetical protein